VQSLSRETLSRVYSSIFVIFPVTGSRTKVPDEDTRELQGLTLGLGGFWSGVDWSDAAAAPFVGARSSAQSAHILSIRHSDSPSSHELSSSSSSKVYPPTRKSMTHCSVSWSLAPGLAHKSTKARSWSSATAVPLATLIWSGSSSGRDPTKPLLREKIHSS
jgi:hypothetical protein